MNGPGRPGRDTAVEERIDARRYLDALRRNAYLIALPVVLISGAVLLVSLSLPKTYHATARIVFEPSTFELGQNDAESVKRRLATTEQLLTSAAVLRKAERRLSLRTGVSVSSTVDERANIISVVGQNESPRKAAAVANAVSDVFLAERRKLDRSRIARARARLEAEIDELKSRGGSAGELEALRDRVSDLNISAASAGEELRIAERASPPSSASSPRPLMNTILAFFGSLFLGVLLALGRDQLVPRFNSTRELSRALELPVLASVPYVRRKLRGGRAMELTGVEDEAYATLRATLEFSSDENRVVLVTSALHGEGKTTATARLGRALARAGHRTLVISADLRVPRLHEAFGLPLGVGLADILAVLDWESASGIAPEVLEKATNVVIAPAKGKRREGSLDVITSGTKVKEPGQLVSGQAMHAFLSEVRGFDYDYILVDAPPLLRVADSQVLSQWVDTMLMVARLDKITLEHGAQLREVLDRLRTQPLGLVVIGTSGEGSPYLTARRTAVADIEAGTSA